MAKAKRGSVELSDVNRELQKVLNSGKVRIGSKETIKAFMRREAKIIIHASNCPEKIKKVFEDADTEGNGDLTIYKYPANNLELGLACGKPYSIASLCITDTGDSEILRLLTSNVHPKKKTLSLNTR
ncbi:50S ribosomal protein L30e [ANME-1 cluster archaeon GoMg4]|nr:50S ribosomal protein L30e [ANME-1 cluster archaeon GoMg4]